MSNQTWPLQEPLEVVQNSEVPLELILKIKEEFQKNRDMAALEDKYGVPLVRQVLGEQNSAKPQVFKKGDPVTLISDPDRKFKIMYVGVSDDPAMSDYMLEATDGGNNRGTVQEKHLRPANESVKNVLYKEWDDVPEDYMPGLVERLEEGKMSKSELLSKIKRDVAKLSDQDARAWLSTFWPNPFSKKNDDADKQNEDLDEKKNGTCELCGGPTNKDGLCTNPKCHYLNPDKKNEDLEEKKNDDLDDYSKGDIIETVDGYQAKVIQVIGDGRYVIRTEKGETRITTARDGFQKI